MVVNSAPQALDTLKELAQALNNDSDYATTVQTQLRNKADKSTTYTKIATDQLLLGKADEFGLSSPLIWQLDPADPTVTKLGILSTAYTNKAYVDDKVATIALTPGPTGAKGDVGPTGPTGLTGAKGDEGDAGTNGTNGVNGINGVSGTNGVNGTAGAKGDVGPTGAEGDVGPTGGIGPT